MNWKNVIAVAAKLGFAAYCVLLGLALYWDWKLQ
jgi:hypothetical protein